MVTKYRAAQIFLTNLKQASKVDYLVTIYHSLFTILPMKDLNQTIAYLYTLSRGRDDYFKEAGKADWFAIWHKSLRQGDFFQDCFRQTTLELLDDKSRKEFKYLSYKVRQEGYVKAGEGKLFNDEYNRYLELSGFARREKQNESINGQLDWILWNAINLDQNKLYDVFVQTFEDIENSQDNNYG